MQIRVNKEQYLFEIVYCVGAHKYFTSALPLSTKDFARVAISYLRNTTENISAWNTRKYLRIAKQEGLIKQKHSLQYQNAQIIYYELTRAGMSYLTDSSGCDSRDLQSEFKDLAFQVKQNVKETQLHKAFPKFMQSRLDV